jgi:hypothetical protein
MLKAPDEFVAERCRGSAQVGRIIGGAFRAANAVCAFGYAKMHSYLSGYRNMAFAAAVFLLRFEEFPQPFDDRFAAPVRRWALAVQADFHFDFPVRGVAIGARQAVFVLTRA